MQKLIRNHLVPCCRLTGGTGQFYPLNQTVKLQLRTGWTFSDFLCMLCAYVCVCVCVCECVCVEVMGIYMKYVFI